MPGTLQLLLVFVLAVGVGALCWWQDFDGVRSAWEYRRRCRGRERLSGEEFFRRFYLGSGIPPDLVIPFRQFHAGYWKEDPELLRPEDDLFVINSGADCAGWAAEVEARFGVTVPETTGKGVTDASFDTVLRYLHRLRTERSRHPL